MALTIQNSTFAQVAFADSPVSLTCKDNNGNTFSRTTVEVDASAGIVAVNLPYIPSLADDLLTEIVVLVTDDTSNITINAVTPPPSPLIPFPVTQSIGSATTLTIASGGGVGQSVILRPVSEGVWSAVITA
jgi:formylmethanofuran dehydrogenase subunit A